NVGRAARDTTDRPTDSAREAARRPAINSPLARPLFHHLSVRSLVAPGKRISLAAPRPVGGDARGLHSAAQMAGAVDGAERALANESRAHHHRTCGCMALDP